MDTEKASSLEEKDKYVFLVSRKANKIEIKNAVEEMFDVTAENVNTANYYGKPISRFTKGGFSRGRKAHYKKAYVTLKEGESINIYSNEEWTPSAT